MNSIAVNRARTTSLRLLIAAVLALSAIFVSGTAATAHDDLIGSTPESGSTVTEIPSEIVLNYSGELQTLADGGGTVVVITDGQGEQIPNEFEITGRDVIVTPTTELSNGDYTVASRVISSDGHPVEKSISFTVAAENAVAEEDETAAAEATEAQNEPSAEPSDATESDTESGTTNTVLWIVLGVVAAGAAVAVLVNFMRRNNTK